MKTISKLLEAAVCLAKIPCMLPIERLAFFRDYSVFFFFKNILFCFVVFQEKIVGALFLKNVFWCLYTRLYLNLLAHTFSQNFMRIFLLLSNVVLEKLKPAITTWWK